MALVVSRWWISLEGHAPACAAIAPLRRGGPSWPLVGVTDAAERVPPIRIDTLPVSPIRHGMGSREWVERGHWGRVNPPLCIHRAPLGTPERFIGFLIEHYAGNFPLWLAPEQVRVLTIGEDEPLLNYAKDVVNQLRAQQVRAEGDYSNDPVKAKIADAETAKVHTMLVIGSRDMEAGNVSVRLHGKGMVGAKPKAEVVADILQAIRERRP